MDGSTSNYNTETKNYGYVENLQVHAILNKGATEWTPAEFEKVSRSDAFANSHNPEHHKAERAVRKYRETHRNQQGDASQSGEVHVTAYDRQRDGHEEHVGEYWRSPPTR